MLPRVLIGAVITLLAACMTIVVFARVTDRPLEAVPPVSAVQAEASFVLTSDAMTGAVSVADPGGTPIIDYAPEEGGFIAGVHRVILRERALRRLKANAPVTLTAYENGRLAIHDPTSGWSADLMGFGTGNADAFARLLAIIEQGRS